MQEHGSLATTIARVLGARPEVLDVYLFGSRSRGDARADSDVDVAVFLAPTTAAETGPWGLKASLLADLMAALGRNDVDLVVLNDAPPLLWKEVLAHGTRLTSRDPVARTTREGQALSRWCDWKPVQDRIDALLLGRTT